MKVEIYDPGEIHLILVEKYQSSSVNIVIKAKIGVALSAETLKKASLLLVEQHPYIYSKYYSEENFDKFRYFYDDLEGFNGDIELTKIKDEDSSILMNSLSEMRTYQFNHEAGELFKISAYQGESTTVIELAASHIIGEVLSIIQLMGDYIRFIDKFLSNMSPVIQKNKKYFFNESDFSWDKCQYNDLGFNVNLPNEEIDNPWDMPKVNLKRYKIKVDSFNKIKKWLADNSIKAKVSDVFYYVANKVLAEKLGRNIDMWLILSYRNKAINEEAKNSLYNFAFFSPVNNDCFDCGSIKSWLESFFNYREKLVTPEGVCLSRNVFYSLNNAMEGKDVALGKNIMNSIVKLPDFAFNNFGRIDSYIGELNNISVEDFEIQDGAPIQEIRYFSLNDKIYFNPTFFIKNNINIDEFLDGFVKSLYSITNINL